MRQRSPSSRLFDGTTATEFSAKRRDRGAADSGAEHVDRRKKILEAFEPPWDQLGPVWQLSVGDFRVFYDVVEPNRVVIVRAVSKKPAHRSTEEIL